MADLAQSAEQLGEQIGGETAGEAAKQIGEIAEWLTETINQWKLKMIVSIVGILILIPLLNVQYFLANLVGLRIPKLLPKMPWWEVMIMGLLDIAVLLLLIIQNLIPLTVITVTCTIPGIGLLCS